MDLDQLIRDADPARHLDIDLPEPHARITSSARREGRVAAILVLVAVVVVVVAVAVVFLGVRHQRAAQPASMPRALPLGGALHQAGPTGVLSNTRRLLQVYPDPDGGPAWGLATYQTQSAMTCLQVGRSQHGLVGAIGEGAFGNDGRFHPFTFSDLGLGTCASDDARGHAFLNIADRRFPANAAQEPCTVPPPRILSRMPARISDRVDRPCPNRPIRDVYFGLLGPDATSITYVAGNGRQRTEPTRGPDGAYLIVRLAATGFCDLQRVRATAPAGCVDNAGGQSGATLSPGEIVAVRYRDGHTCRLPTPQGNIVQLGSQCPPIGYTAPAGPSYTATQLAAPVTARKLLAQRYCQRSGSYQPAALPIPCDTSVPPGYRPFPGQRQLLVYISWTARAPVKNTQASSYSYTLQHPRACGGTTEGNSTQAIIRTGERVTRPFFVLDSCHGTYTGVVTYIPNLGPDGARNLGLGSASPGNGVLLVGRFSFTVP